MSTEKKIIIDEDWKSQVEAERTALHEKSAEPATQSQPAEADDPEYPPASLEMLISSLATEAMMALGQIPHPITGEAKLRKNQAKYLIDTIAVIQDKSKGNLSPGEADGLENLLHQLRIAFVSLTSGK